jgi:hypothetical protein
MLCDIPQGRTGRPSKSLTLAQAEMLLAARKSRRILKLPQRCVDALRDHQARQEEIRRAAGSAWHDNDLVLPSRVGTPADASHVRRSFRKVVAAAGLDPREWTPRELRHSSRCFLMPMSLSSTPRAWSATAARPRQRRSTADPSGDHARR